MSDDLIDDGARIRCRPAQEHLGGVRWVLRDRAALVEQDRRREEASRVAELSRLDEVLQRRTATVHATLRQHTEVVGGDGGARRRRPLQKLDRPARVPGDPVPLHQRDREVDRPVRTAALGCARVEIIGGLRGTGHTVAGLHEEAEAHHRAQIAPVGGEPVQGDRLSALPGRCKRPREQGRVVRHLWIRVPGSAAGRDRRLAVAGEFVEGDAGHIGGRVTRMRRAAGAEHLWLQLALLGAWQSLKQLAGRAYVAPVRAAVDVELHERPDPRALRKVPEPVVGDGIDLRGAARGAGGLRSGGGEDAPRLGDEGALGIAAEIDAQQTRIAARRSELPELRLGRDRQRLAGAK